MTSRHAEAVQILVAADGIVVNPVIQTITSSGENC